MRIAVVIPAHNGERSLPGLLQRLRSLSLPQDMVVGFTVVDDGSTDGTAQVLGGAGDERLQVVSLPTRGGRANACNRGAAAADADVLLFLDADCEPLGDGYFFDLARRLGEGAELVYGPITGRGEGFWPRYLQGVEVQRAKAAAAGDHALAMTTGNLAVSRQLFERVGGFSSDYRHYGFEDKDLIARLLAQHPAVAFEPGCAVVHEAGNTVANYCAKMREAARWTAPLFASRYPDIYRRMAYARLDPALAGSLRRPLLVSAGRLLTAPALQLADLLVERRAVPWAIQAFAVRAAAALSFLRGCAERLTG